MDEQFEFLRTIIRRLDDAGVPYMLTGSLALAIRARPRMTRDVEVVIEADAAAEQSMFNVIHLTSLRKADFILRRDEPYERAKWRTSGCSCGTCPSLTRDTSRSGRPPCI